MDPFLLTGTLETKSSTRKLSHAKCEPETGEQLIYICVYMYIHIVGIRVWWQDCHLECWHVFIPRMGILFLECSLQPLLPEY